MSSTPETSIKAPPRTFFPMLLAIGPGIVVTGSVMGSGELINTPIQAAKFGFILLWAVLLSCVIKIFVQIEIGRHAIAHRRTTFEMLNTIPGPQWRKTGWVGLLYMAGVGFTAFTYPGMLKAIGGMMQMIVPLHGNLGSWTPANTWAVVSALSVFVLLWRDSYEELEHLITVMVGAFSLTSLVAIVMIQRTEYAISWSELASGMTFSMSTKETAFAVVSLMGALGTAGNELFMYPYWILERGYASYVGEDKDDQWVSRARGWIKVMQLDTTFCTLLTAATTAAFFLMGAAVFHRRGVVPGNDTIIDQLSQVFTESFGPWSKIFFLIGAFCTLFSTLVVAIAAGCRMWTDMFASLGFLDGHDHRALRRGHRTVAVIYVGTATLIAVGTSFDPGVLIQFSQFVLGVFSTPILMLAIGWLAMHTDERIRMSRKLAVPLWLSIILVVASLVYAGVHKMM
ncbi:MAG: Nramp family divalent metal transporter [Planctomycetales bacterium]|nr:Nramp family divalent metal transporter [Planctomycetales bacterium]